MPEKMRAILEKYQSYKKSSVPEKLFQAGYSTHINFSPPFTTTKKLSGTKNFNIINNEVSEEFKNKLV
jgi:hypothetical protein